MNTAAPSTIGHSAGQAYRPDIDGLRALAVLPVLLYHAKVPGFAGGFIGVDIFFVISGFLITGIIAREIDAGEFSILRFYERRARRILPALLAMIAFALVAASLLFLPSDFAGVAPSALAAIGFLANVWLFTQTGYFQGSAETTPLLHTWSLGVEEQFYIGLPIMLIIVARYAPAWRVKAIVALTLISFIWAVLKQADSDGFAFYLLPTRAWELFAGSLLAMGVIPAIKKRVLAEGLCLASLIAIIAATMLYDSQTVFPGMAALAPVIAATVLIHCANGTWTGRILSMKGPVWIGLISYSLYLWHWPIIVFWRYTLDGPLTGADSAALIAVSIVIAWASWKFVEQPFRSKALFPAKRMWRWSFGGMGVLTAILLALLPQGGWSARFDPDTLKYAQATADHSPVRDQCITGRVKDHPEACTLGADVTPSALIWGDSHGVEFAWVLGQRYDARGASIVQRTRGSCAPVIGYDPANDTRCAAFNDGVLEEIAASSNIHTVYLAGYWAQSSYHEAHVDALLDQTIGHLQSIGKQVILIGPVPTHSVEVPRLLALHGPDALTLPTDTFTERTRWFTRRFPVWRARGVSIINPIDRLNNDGQTMIVAGGQPLYYDNHHLSLAGARYILGPHPLEELPQE